MSIHAGLHQSLVHLVSFMLLKKKMFDKVSKNILHPYLVSSSLQKEPDHHQVALVTGKGQGELLELVAVDG